MRPATPTVSSQVVGTSVSSSSAAGSLSYAVGMSDSMTSGAS